MKHEIVELYVNFKKKLKIGEFSQLMQVTVKPLRHYEQKGLLVPDEVDEWTGNIAQATSMEPGTKKTQRNGSLSFRYQSNNQSLSAIPELRSPTRSLSLSWGRH